MTAPDGTADTVAVWRVPPCTASDLLAHGEGIARMLSAPERERAARLARDDARALFVTTRLLARAALASATDTSPTAWQVSAQPRERPLAVGPTAEAAPFVSLSHTRGLVACAVSRVATGIDVEHRDRGFDPMAMARRCLAPSEIEELSAHAASARAERFLEYWTLKEAVLKACGVGLRVPMKEVVLELHDEGSPAVCRMPAAVLDAQYWTLRCMRPSRRHMIAVAAARRSRGGVTIREHDTTAEELLAMASRA